MLFRAIKQLFTQNQLLPRLLEQGHPFRDVELENLAKMLACGTSVMGTRHYACANPQCIHQKAIALSCKSRLCNSCGHKATENWIHQQGEVLPDCSYRHLTFTMPDVYWSIFKLNRQLLGPLFVCATRGLQHFAQKKGWHCGIFAALHTYGRELTWHPHVHVSVAEWAITSNGELRRFSYPFKQLMPMWRYSLTKLLREHFGQLHLPEELQAIGQDQTAWNALLDHHYHRRWHVHIAKETTKKWHTQRYLGRYLKKPPVSSKRLRHIGWRHVELSFRDHRDGQHKRKRLTQEEMALRVLTQVPEKHFRMVRYYGFLSNRLRSRYLPTIYALLDQKPNGVWISYAGLMKRMLNVDPFECLLCGSRLEFVGMTLGLSLAERIWQLHALASLRQPSFHAG